VQGASCEEAVFGQGWNGDGEFADSAGQVAFGDMDDYELPEWGFVA
jgi:hypothetical protein